MIVPRESIMADKRRREELRKRGVEMLQARLAQFHRNQHLFDAARQNMETRRGRENARQARRKRRIDNAIAFIGIAAVAAVVFAATYALLAALAALAK